MKNSLFKMMLTVLLIMFFSLSCSWDESNKVDRTYIVITFDDQHHSIYNIALPLMKQFGFRATNAVNTGVIGANMCLTWNQVEELEFQYGWETAGHTLHHANLPDCTYEEAFIEIKQDWLNLKERNLSHETFVLPRGHATLRDYEIITQFYANIRNSKDLKMFYPVNRLNIGYFAYLTSYTADDVIMRITEGVLNQEALIIIGFHRFNDPDHSHSCSEEDLQRILQFIYDQELPVLTLKEAVNILQ